jgi:hypothetical protein
VDEQHGERVVVSRAARNSSSSAAPNETPTAALKAVGQRRRRLVERDGSLFGRDGAEDIEAGGAAGGADSGQDAGDGADCHDDGQV